MCLSVLELLIEQRSYSHIGAYVFSRDLRDAVHTRDVPAVADQDASARQRQIEQESYVCDLEAYMNNRFKTVLESLDRYSVYGIS